MKLLYQPELIKDLTPEEKAILDNKKESLVYHKRMASFLNTALVDAVTSMEEEQESKDETTEARIVLDDYIIQLHNILAVMDQLDSGANDGTKAIYYYNLAALLSVNFEPPKKVLGLLKDNLLHVSRQIRDQDSLALRKSIQETLSKKSVQKREYTLHPHDFVKRSFQIFLNIPERFYEPEDELFIIEQAMYLLDLPPEFVGLDLYLRLLGFLDRQLDLDEDVWNLILCTLSNIISLPLAPEQLAPYATRLQNVLKIMDWDEFYYDFARIYTGLVKCYIRQKNFMMAEKYRFDGRTSIDVSKYKDRPDDYGRDLDYFTHTLKQEIGAALDASTTPAFMYSSVNNAGSKTSRQKEVKEVKEIKNESAYSITILGRTFRFGRANK